MDPWMTEVKMSWKSEMDISKMQELEVGEEDEWVWSGVMSDMFTLDEKEDCSIRQQQRTFDFSPPNHTWWLVFKRVFWFYMNKFTWSNRFEPLLFVAFSYSWVAYISLRHCSRQYNSILSVLVPHLRVKWSTSRLMESLFFDYPTFLTLRFDFVF